MNQEKKDELLIHLLVNIQAEVQATRDFICGYIILDKKLNHSQTDILESKYQEKLLDCKATILAEIRLHYNKDLGDVDDLLNTVFPKK
jgi:hypothetical protein